MPKFHSACMKIHCHVRASSGVILIEFSTLACAERGEPMPKFHSACLNIRHVRSSSCVIFIEFSTLACAERGGGNGNLCPNFVLHVSKCICHVHASVILMEFSSLACAERGEPMPKFQCGCIKLHLPNCACRNPSVAIYA